MLPAGDGGPAVGPVPRYSIDGEDPRGRKNEDAWSDGAEPTALEEPERPRAAKRSAAALPRASGEEPPVCALIQEMAMS